MIIITIITIIITKIAIILIIIMTNDDDDDDNDHCNNNNNDNIFLPQESLFICLHFDTKLSSLPWKIMALEISMHKLFLTGVSASSLTFFEYLSMIFFLYYILCFLFKTIYVLNRNLLTFLIKIISASYL